MNKLLSRITHVIHRNVIGSTHRPQVVQVKFAHHEVIINEDIIRDKLRGQFPQAKAICVEDTSGGCGAMFTVQVESDEFKGLSVMKQHRLVYDCLKEELKGIHGLHLETKTCK